VTEENVTERGGLQQPPGQSAEDLLWARDLLVAPPVGRRRLVGADLREALVDLHDFWLAGHAARAGLTSTGGAALVAVGALGRRELVPFSDLDLLLVHDGNAELTKTAEQLWYPLWNAGIGLDHSVRTVRESLSVAASDLRVALGLLELRFIAGEADVAERLSVAAKQAWRTGARNRLDELANAAAERWERSGEVAQRVEPDLKHGRGGLRDLQLLDALAMAQLVDRPSGEVADARGLLLDVRTELRRVVRKARDVLRAQDADEVAVTLGMSDRFELAGVLSSAGRSVSYAVDVAIRGIRTSTPRRRVVPGLRRSPVRRPLGEGVVLHGSEVTLAREVDPARDPALLTRLAAAAARAGAPIAVGTIARLTERAPELRRPWPAAARESLFALLAAGPGLINVVETLDRTGLWGRLFPEWGVVRDLPPRDAVHIWTVDRHLVQTAVQAARLATTVSRPDLLLIGALLHDIGKGRNADHSVVGAALAAQIGERIGLPPADVDTLSAIVRHHLLLPHTATRRDVEDPATVLRVVETLGGDRVLLELLQALAEADSLAVGPGVWTDWKASLIGSLVEQCATVMAGGAPPGPEPLDDQQRALAAAVAESGRPGVLMSSDETGTTVTVIATDRTGLLVNATGVLALHSLAVHAATLSVEGGMAVNVFRVSPRFGSPPDVSLLREELTRALDGSLHLAERLARKEQDYPRPVEVAEPRVLWFDDEASDAVVLELRATDQIGLLYRVAAALQRAGADVRWARIATPGATVVNSFCLTMGGRTHPDAASRRKIEEAVLASAG
jgi:[protein-PII] uridylyltransferase